MKKPISEKLTFRINTPGFLKEITECGARMGIFFIPMNTFQSLLAQVAGRAIKLNDPIMNKLMFDLALYEEANPTSNKDYSKTLKNVYAAAERQAKKENKQNKK